MDQLGGVGKQGPVSGDGDKDSGKDHPNTENKEGERVASMTPTPVAGVPVSIFVGSGPNVSINPALPVNVGGHARVVPAHMAHAGSVHQLRPVVDAKATGDVGMREEDKPKKKRGRPSTRNDCDAMCTCGCDVMGKACRNKDEPCECKCSKCRVRRRRARSTSSKWNFKSEHQRLEKKLRQAANKSTVSTEIRIGTRDSKLAMWQAKHIQEELRKANPDRSFVLVPMKTIGDKVLNVPIAAIGETGVFTKELERGLFDRKIDIAVHCLKDMPSQIVHGLTLAATTNRHDPRDCLVISARHKGKYKSIEDLPEGSLIGTSSVRRRATLARMFPSFKFHDIRGNLQTRLNKLDNGHEGVDFDAIILATAGMERLDLHDRISQVLPAETFMYAAGQGALTIQLRADDVETMKLVTKLHHHESAVCCAAERAVLSTLEGSCKLPLGVDSKLDEVGRLTLAAAVWSESGDQMIRKSAEGEAPTEQEAAKIGIDLARRMQEDGASEIIARLKSRLPAPAGQKNDELKTQPDEPKAKNYLFVQFASGAGGKLDEIKKKRKKAEEGKLPEASVSADEQKKRKADSREDTAKRPKPTEKEA